MNENEIVSTLHYEIIRQLINTSACPSNSQLAIDLGCSESEIEQRMMSLAAIHGVVLHPHRNEPWVIHPFSITPTLNWVENENRGWWAPCVWCALGIAAVVPGELQIHTRIGAQAEPLIIQIRDGQVVSSESILVHFAIPPAQAWDNVHRHCSMVLPFHSLQDITNWCHRHQLPQGEPVPIHQVASLARNWYGTHASPTWRKWSVDEAQEIFHKSGLTSSFWNLGTGKGKF